MLVDEAHFGGNMLWDNTENGVPKSAVVAAIEALNITHIRFPAGQAETAFNVTELENGELSGGTRNFLEWAHANDKKVILVIPTATFYPDNSVDIFVEKALNEFGDVIATFEIGNEYWNKDVGLTETQYGERTDAIISEIELGVDRQIGSYDPDIIVQMGNPSGLASEVSLAQRPDLTWLEAIEAANQKIYDGISASNLEQIDAMVYHYYYNDALRFESSSAELNFFNERWDFWKENLREDIQLHMTEWNVQRFNHDVVGLKSVPLMIFQMASMLSSEVEQAYVWPLNFNTANDLAGNLDVMPSEDQNGIVTNNLLGATFDMLSTNTVGLEFKSFGGSGFSDDLLTTVFESEQKAVIYLSSHTDNGFSATVNLNDFGYDFHHIDGLQLGYDPNTSNGTYYHHIEKAFVEADFLLLDLDGDGNANEKYVLNEHDVSAQTQAFVWDPQSTSIDVNLRPYETLQIVFDLSTYFEISGTNSHETLVGTAQRDEIRGLLGNDILRGWGESDILFGDKGNDKLYGHSGDDTLWGGDGFDSIFGGSGDDVIIDTSGKTFADGGQGADIVVGIGGVLIVEDRASEDISSLPQMDDLIIGGSFNDDIATGIGDDVIFADGFAGFVGGNDRIRAGEGIDLLNGGPGADTFVFTPQNDLNTIADYSGIFADWQSDWTALDRDFDPTQDEIILEAFESLDGWQDIHLSLSSSQGNTIFSAEGTTIHLIGVALTELTSSNFSLASYEGEL